MDLDIRHLKLLIVVADKESIRAAAAELKLAQPNLTQQIQRIERKLQAKVFHRSPAGVRETDFGRELLRRARWIVREVEMLSRIRPRASV